MLTCERENAFRKRGSRVCGESNQNYAQTRASGSKHELPEILVLSEQYAPVGKRKLDDPLILCTGKTLGDRHYVETLRT